VNISLNNEEIESALRQFVKSLGIDLTNKEIDITMVAGRGGNGYKAEISIESKLDIPKASKTIVEEEKEEIVEEVSSPQKSLFSI